MLRTLKGASLIKCTNDISRVLTVQSPPLRLLAQPVAKVMCELGLEAPQSFQSVSSLCQALLCLPLSHQNALQELFFPDKAALRN